MTHNGHPVTTVTLYNFTPTLCDQAGVPIPPRESVKLLRAEIAATFGKEDPEEVNLLRFGVNGATKVIVELTRTGTVQVWAHRDVRIRKRG